MADRITIVEVARACGVSVSSASVALRGEPGVSEATRERVLAAAERIGYRPDRRARLLREGRPRVLGVTFSLHAPFHAEIVDALYSAAADAGYDLILSGTTALRSTHAAIDSLLTDQCESMILISPEGDLAGLEPVLTGRTVVVVGTDAPVPWADVVRSDGRGGAALAVEHLVGLGHRDIAYISGGDAVASESRRQGYLESMAAQGLRRHAVAVEGGSTEPAGIAAARELLGHRRRPTAVIAHNDLVAFGAMMALRDQNISVPEDVSIIGHDNTRTASLIGVDLSSVDQLAGRLAAAAVERVVLRSVDPAARLKEITLTPELVLRRSVAPHGSI